MSPFVDATTKGYGFIVLRLYGLASEDLGAGIDAETGGIANAIPHDLCDMQHRLVFGPEAALFDAEHSTIVNHADQKVATLGVEERVDGLDACMSPSRACCPYGPPSGSSRGSI